MYYIVYLLNDMKVGIGIVIKLHSYKYIFKQFKFNQFYIQLRSIIF